MLFLFPFCVLCKYFFLLLLTWLQPWREGEAKSPVFELGLSLINFERRRGGRRPHCILLLEVVTASGGGGGNVNELASFGGRGRLEEASDWQAVRASSETNLNDGESTCRDRELGKKGGGGGGKRSLSEEKGLTASTLKEVQNVQSTPYPVQVILAKATVVLTFEIRCLNFSGLCTYYVHMCQLYFS